MLNCFNQISIVQRGRNYRGAGHTCVHHLPKITARRCSSRDSNPRLVHREVQHPKHCIVATMPQCNAPTSFHTSPHTLHRALMITDQKETFLFQARQFQKIQAVKKTKLCKLGVCDHVMTESYTDWFEAVWFLCKIYRVFHHHGHQHMFVWRAFSDNVVNG